jgi:hypothetical protein
MKTIKKNQIYRLLLISGIILLGVSGYAQATGIIKGRVLDSNKQPVVYATATIIDPETMQIVEGDMCDDNGEFMIEHVKSGEYILSIRNVGFQKDESRKIKIDAGQNTIRQGDIILNESVENLNELEVTVKREVPEAGSKS